jgi:hypothetical protein
MHCSLLHVVTKHSFKVSERGDWQPTLTTSTGMSEELIPRSVNGGGTSQDSECIGVKAGNPFFHHLQ